MLINYYTLFSGLIQRVQISIQLRGARVDTLLNGFQLENYVPAFINTFSHAFVFTINLRFIAISAIIPTFSISCRAISFVYMTRACIYTRCSFRKPGTYFHTLIAEEKKIILTALRCTVLTFLHIATAVHGLNYLILRTLGHIFNANYMVLLYSICVRWTLRNTHVSELFQLAFTLGRAHIRVPRSTFDYSFSVTLCAAHFRVTYSRQTGVPFIWLALLHTVQIPTAICSNKRRLTCFDTF